MTSTRHFRRLFLLFAWLMAVGIASAQSRADDDKTRSAPRLFFLARLGEPTPLADDAVERAPAPRTTPPAPVYPSWAQQRVDMEELRQSTPAFYRCWAEAGFVLGWIQGARLPALATVSAAGTSVTSAGVLGTPGTSVVIGDNRVNGDMRPGGQFSLGTWLDSTQTCGVEAGFLFLPARNAGFLAGSNGDTIVARPFIDPLSGSGAAELVSFPGILAGTVSVDARSDPLYGANLTLRHALCSTCNRQFYLLGGYRFLSFGEDLRIQENLTSLDPVTLGSQILVTDRFRTSNQFHGAEAGLLSRNTWGSFSLDVLGKLAVGNVWRQVRIDGSTDVTVPGFAMVSNAGGLLALPSNIGRYTSNKTGMVPELAITGGWQLSPRVRATLGYTFFWWTDIVRPADQIDPVVNPNLLPNSGSSGGPARPFFTQHDSDLWVQALRLGMEIRY